MRTQTLHTFPPCQVIHKTVETRIAVDIATPTVLPTAESRSSTAQGLQVESGWLDMAYQQRNVLCRIRRRRGQHAEGLDTPGGRGCTQYHAWPGRGSLRTIDPSITTMPGQSTPGEGLYSFVACLGRLTIDHASLPRPSTVPTRDSDRQLQHLAAQHVSSKYCIKSFAYLISFLFGRLRPPSVS